MSDLDYEARAYDQLCQSYRAIDDFRSKLLGFLPVVTGAGIVTLSKEVLDAGSVGAEKARVFTAIGAFGAMVTLGLFAYEIYGIKKCGALIKAGQRAETMLNVKSGQFQSRPQNVARVVNEPFAAGVIYPAALAAWTFFALAFQWPKANPEVPVLVFIIGLVGTLLYDRDLRRQ